MEEYRCHTTSTSIESIKGEQTDKSGDVIALYVDDPGKARFCGVGKAEGYDVLVMDGQLIASHINFYARRIRGHVS